MTKLAWGQSGTRLYEVGVDRGVLYVRQGPGVAWNGLTSVQESVSGGDVSSYYLDGIKYLDVVANEDYKATVGAFAAPAEFGPCDGIVTLAPGLAATQQPRQKFGFSYRTLLGNDSEGDDHGYKLHLVYNILASPSQKNNKTLGGTPDPTDLSWEFNSVPPPAIGYKPTAHFVVDSTKGDPDLLAALEAVLYGDDTKDPELPSQADVITILSGS